MSAILNHLKNRRLVWQATQQQASASLDSTGFPELDTQLQGGLPARGVMDIHSPVGIGELRLLLPTLLRRHLQSERLLVIIAPPLQLNSEMLAEQGLAIEHILIIKPEQAKQALWSAEQCLKSGCCHSVLLWHNELEVHQVKRLQLAAEQGDALQVLMRPPQPSGLSLPVSLAMQLTPWEQGIGIHIHKRKGGWPAAPFNLNMRQYWPALTVQQDAQNVIPFPHAKVS